MEYTPPPRSEDEQLFEDEWHSSRFADFVHQTAAVERPDIVRTIEGIVEQYGQYRTLKGQDRQIARKYYEESQCQRVRCMNPALQAPGKCIHVKAADGTLIATRYERVTVSDHGSYVEIKPSCLSEHFARKIQGAHGVELRGTKNTVFRIEQPKCELYRQNESVQFGDFVPGMYYVKPTQVFFENVESPMRPLAPATEKRTIVPQKDRSVVKATTAHKKRFKKRRKGQTSMYAYVTNKSGPLKTE